MSLLSGISVYRWEKRYINFYCIFKHAIKYLSYDVAGPNSCFIVNISS